METTTRRAVLPRLPMHAGTAPVVASRALRGPRSMVRGDAVFPAVLATAAAEPDRIAVLDGGREIGYGQLAARARQFRAGLLAAGCGRGDFVVVAGSRSVDTIAVVLAIETLGAVYVPVDPEWPVERLVGVLRGATPSCLVALGAGSDRASDAAGLAGVPVVDAPAADAPEASGAVTWSADEQRYVIHTSGSTGRAKGMVVAHSGLVNHLWSVVDALRLNRSDTVAFTAAPTYVVSLWQILAAFLVGGRVAVVDEGDARFGRRLVTALTAAGATVAELVPTVVGWLVDEVRRRPALPRLRCLLTTGEPMRPALAAEVLRSFPGVELVNAYGAAECSDDVALHRISPADVNRPRLPAGRPLPDVALYLLVDEGGRWRAASPGEAGELWVGGAGVGLGYLGRPDLTDAAFFLDEFDAASPTGRVYRTGDLAVFADGLVHCLGQVDRQVKIAGVRVELDEVEAVVGGLEGVSACAVLRTHEQDESHLVVHVVALPDISNAQLRKAAQDRVPAALVPRHWIRHDDLPRTGSGKVDYQELAARQRS